MTEPTFGPCPSWCLTKNAHDQAIEEGCTHEEAAVHPGPDFSGFNGREGYAVTLRADPGPGAVAWFGRPMVELETRKRNDDGSYDRVSVDIPTGDARSLATFLIHVADLAELHS